MDKSCKDRVREAFNSRMSDIRIMWDRQQLGERISMDSELPPLEEYGLSIDYVERGTWSKPGQPKSEPYWRYQLSWGGPSEEFRLYDSGVLQFWFLDWFDGAYVIVKGRDAEIIKNIIANAE